MGYIREPKGVDFLVAPTILTEDDTRAIKAAIACYKQAEATIVHHDAVFQHPVRSNSKIVNGNSKKPA
jgi:hypothetical protein